MLGNDNELQKYLLQIEQYKEQINALEEQQELIDAAISDYNKAKITLNKIKDSEKNTEMLLPIGGRTFINAKAIDPSKVLFDIGSGLVAEKKSESAIERIEEIIDQLSKKQNEVSDMIQKMQTAATQLTQRAQQMYMDQQRNQQ